MRPLALASVLVATDLHASSQPALDSGHRLASAAGARLHVVHVEEPGRPDDAGGPTRDAAAAALVESLREAGIPEGAAEMHLASGPAAPAIRAIADEVAADVIVLGRRRDPSPSGRAGSLGGTALEVVTEAFAPCLVAAKPLQVPLERVLVPVDLSATARGALLVALSWASALRTRRATDTHTTLTALRVADDARAGDAGLAAELERLRRHAGTWAGVGMDALTLPGSSDVAATICATANERRSDLVVIGTRGHGLDEQARLGSVSAAVIERAPAALLLVPPAIWRVHGETY